MNLRAISLICFCLMLWPLSHTQASTPGPGCQELLQQTPGRHLKILSRLEKLNPTLARELSSSEDSSLQSLERIYLHLKQEAWAYLPIGILPFSNRKALPQEVKVSITENFQKQYAVGDLNDEKLTLFYANGLWSIYLSTLQTWSEDVAVSMLPPQEDPPSRSLKNFGVSILTKSLMGADLQNQSLSPEMAARVFQERLWESFPWSTAYGIAKDWLAQQNEERSKIGYKEVREWLESHPQYNDLDPKQRAIVEEGLLQPGLEDVCCKSEPGCAFCPNNRSWLIKSNKAE